MAQMEYKNKHHIILDKNGFLIAAIVCAANIHNSKAGLLLLRLLKEELINFRLILTKAGYRGNLLDKAQRFYSHLIKYNTQR